MIKKGSRVYIVKKVDHPCWTPVMDALIGHVGTVEADSNPEDPPEYNKLDRTYLIKVTGASQAYWFPLRCLREMGTFKRTANVKSEGLSHGFEEVEED